MKGPLEESGFVGMTRGTEVKASWARALQSWITLPIKMIRTTKPRMATDQEMDKFRRTEQLIASHKVGSLIALVVLVLATSVATSAERAGPIQQQSEDFKLQHHHHRRAPSEDSIEAQGLRAAASERLLTRASDPPEVGALNRSLSVVGLKDRERDQDKKQQRLKLVTNGQALTRMGSIVSQRTAAGNRSVPGTEPAKLARQVDDGFSEKSKTQHHEPADGFEVVEHRAEQHHHHHHHQQVLGRPIDHEGHSQQVEEARHHQSEGHYPQQPVDYGQQLEQPAGGSQPPIQTHQDEGHLQQQYHLADPKHHSANIRVVFNNNPRFIIGSTGRETAEHSDSGAPPPALYRRTRQPSSTLLGDDYNSDESSPDGTKVASRRRPCEHSKDEAGPPPVVGQSGGKLPRNMEQVDLQQPDSQQAPEQQIQEPPVEVGRPEQQKKSGQRKSKAPPIEQSFESVKQEDEQQVDSPFDQLVKSGMRPPLRMVFTMRNKQGDLMKVPVNFQGSMKAQQRPVQVAGTKIQFEQQRQQKSDENTPIGGDVFDPNIVRPFAKKGPKTAPPMEPFRQQVATGDELTEGPPLKVAVKTEEPPVQQQLQQQQLLLQTKKADCNEDRADQQQVEPKQEQISQEGPVVMPISVDSGDGTVQMIMPQLTKFQNKTFATMLDQFQRALHDQMVLHLAGRGQSKVQQIDEEQQQQLQDEQEDLAVAMVAANMSGQRSPGGGQLSMMTVIRPPKGTSLGEALRKHSNKDRMDTVAILHSGSPPVSQLADGPQTGSSPPTVFGVDVRLRSAQRPQLSLDGAPMGRPAEADVDPNGFSSSSISSSLTDGFNFGPSENHRAQGRQYLGRFKRSAEAEYKRHLEPGDKLSIAKQAPKSVSRESLKKPAGRQRDPIKAKRPAIKTVSKASHGNSKSIADIKRRLRSSKASNRKRANAKDAFLASASQNDEVSTEGDGDEEDSDEADGGDSSSADSAGDESSAASSPSESSSSDSDSDYGGDLGADDFDDASGFDNDDEAYNQAASSERDYSGASFEIPQIEINPETLQQKGCRTVLREVQEIPMNGLGSVQANGQPGSGYQSSSEAVHPSQQRLGGLRVKRSSPSDSNSINSRKMTSIVMTKECHFPNDSEDSKQRRKLVKAREPAKRKQHFGNQSGASQASQLVAKPPTGSHVTYGALSQPNYQVLGQYPGYQLVGAAKQPSGGFYQHQQQQVVPVVQPTQQTGANFYLPASSQPQPTFAAALQPLQASSFQQAGSSIRRRSIELQSPPTPPTPQQPLLGRLKPRAVQAKGAQSPERDLYLGSASRRNEVVAQKLYKPPSQDDPYHTLSYTSTKGVDPDMSSDDDDRAVMGADDDPSPGAPQGSHPNQRASASNRMRMRETLSSRERAALLDPNHDDTDPVVAGSVTEALESDGFDEDENEGDLNDGESQFLHQRRLAPMSSRDLRAGPRTPSGPSSGGPRFGQSYKFEHVLGRSQAAVGLPSHLRNLAPGQQQGFVSVNGRQQALDAGKMAGQLLVSRRSDAGEDDVDDSDDDGEAEGEGEAPMRRQSAPASASGSSDDGDPDADPEYNPKETHLPAHSKPKRTEKSFAYVHRDVPKGAAGNSEDDFIVSYGRGNLQTEHEDYDSDRENNPPADRRQDSAQLHPLLARSVAGPAGKPAHPSQPSAREAQVVSRKYVRPSARPLLAAYWTH